MTTASRPEFERVMIEQVDELDLRGIVTFEFDERFLYQQQQQQQSLNTKRQNRNKEK